MPRSRGTTAPSRTTGAARWGLARLTSSRMSSPPTTAVPTPGSSVKRNCKEDHRTIDAFTVVRSSRLGESIEAHLAKTPSLGVRPDRRPPATLLKELGSARGSALVSRFPPSRPTPVPTWPPRKVTRPAAGRAGVVLNSCPFVSTRGSRPGPPAPSGPDPRAPRANPSAGQGAISPRWYDLRGPTQHPPPAAPRRATVSSCPRR
jgi:hypothetical protein